MNVEDWCNMTVAAAEADTGIREIAQMMQEYDVDQVVVVHEAGTLVTPIGIITGRDLALRSLLGGVDSSRLTAADIMSRQLLTVSATDDIESALLAMRSRKVSRAPVVDEEGALIGILLISEVLASMSKLTVEMSFNCDRGVVQAVGDISAAFSRGRSHPVSTRAAGGAPPQGPCEIFDFLTYAQRRSQATAGMGIRF